MHKARCIWLLAILPSMALATSSETNALLIVTLELPKRVFAVGEPIHLKTICRNASATNSALGARLAWPINPKYPGYCPFRIVDEGGVVLESFRQTALQQRTKQSTNWVVSSYSGPGGSLLPIGSMTTDTFDLAQLYPLEHPGRYTVEVGPSEFSGLHLISDRLTFSVEAK